MPHVSDPIDLETSPAKPGFVLITRRTWDSYFALAAVAAGLVGGVSWGASGSVRHLGPGVLLLVLWLTLRWGWPVQGQATPSFPIPDRRVPLLIAFGLIWLVLFMVTARVVDGLFPPPPTDWAVSAGRVVVAFAYVPAFVGWFIVGRWIGRRIAKGK